MNNVFRILTLIIFLIIFIACSKDLTRSKAASLIKEKAKITVTETLKEGKFTLYGATDKDYKPYKLLHAQGFIIFKKISYDTSIVKLTEKIKPFVLSKDNKKKPGEFILGAKPRFYYNEVKVILWKKTLGKITGIKNVEGNLGVSGCNAIAEFTYEVEVTPIGKILYSPSDINRKRKACFTLYDDGWRIN